MEGGVDRLMKDKGKGKGKGKRPRAGKPGISHEARLEIVRAPPSRGPANATH
ncbi:MAG: hypothetical protein J2P50_04175 [Hyphomicrobiaceae bacterium]|nr:hypothetical protein [Hyphomicrobiaceae bacterium]